MHEAVQAGYGCGQAACAHTVYLHCSCLCVYMRVHKCVYVYMRALVHTPYVRVNACVQMNVCIYACARTHSMCMYTFMPIGY